MPTIPSKQEGRVEVFGNIFPGSAPTNKWTVDHSKHALGFEQLTDATGALGIDQEGKYFRCIKTKNRPFDKTLCEGLMKIILTGKWVGNGANPFVINQLDILDNGNHRAIAHVWAQQLVNKLPATYADVWPGGKVELDLLVVYGTDPSDKTVDIYDTGKPRGLDDVIYRSEYFADVPDSQRKAMSRTAKAALSLVATRSSQPNICPKRFHGDSMKFLQNHPRFLEAVRVISKEFEKDKIVRRYAPLGRATALFYMMATCRTDGDAYRLADPVSEALMDFSEWEKALTFWKLTVGLAAETQMMRDAICALPDGGTTPQKLAIIIKGWRAFEAYGKVEKSDTELGYNSDQELIERPLCGGIDDGGESDDDDESEETPAAQEAAPPTPAEVAKTAAQIKEENAKALKEKNEKKKAEKKARAEADARAEASANGDGAPRPKPMTRREIQADNTRKAAEADAKLAAANASIAKVAGPATAPRPVPRKPAAAAK